MSVLAVVISSLFVNLFVSSALAARVPAALKGTWKITKVFTSANNRSSNQVPVGKFVGARLSFDSKLVKLVNITCNEPLITSETANFSALTVESIKPNETINSAYSLDVAADESGELIRMSCGKSKKIALPSSSDGEWFSEKAVFLRKNGQLIVALSVDGIYLAEREVETQVAKPSFDCARASTKTEKAICSDQKLAGLDLQMANVYRVATDSAKSWGDEGECLKSVKKAHAIWLKKRNACGANVKCLEDSIKDQIEIESGNLDKWQPKGCPIG